MVLSREGALSVGHVSNLKLAAGLEKSIDDSVLNRLGLQPARAAAAHLRLRTRRWPDPADPDTMGRLARLRRDGWVEIPGFLAPDDLREVQEVATLLLDAADQPRDHLAQGGNTLEVIWRCDVEPEHRKVLDRFFGHHDFLELAGAITKARLDVGAGRCNLARLTQRSGARDLQAAIHVDTFHPTHKAWLYLTDVAEQDGPLVYYPRSHRLSGQVLRHIYKESLGRNEGSRRIGADEIDERGLQEIQLLRPANTLVIADTSGYHGRAQGIPPGGRLALQVELRPDPFRRPGRIGQDRSRAAAAGGRPQ